MRYLGLATAIAVTTLLGLAGLGVANEPEATPVASAVITQLVLRDHTVTLTSAPAGYLYTITDSAGTVLNADLTEAQFAEQYPELLAMLQPAIADDSSELMMLAPMIDQ